MGTPRFLVVGHITQDHLAGGAFRLGGTAFYAAITAARLGYAVAVYTAIDPALDLSPLSYLATGLVVCARSAPRNTTFYNRYLKGKRDQYLLARAPPLSPEGLPPAWRDSPLVLLGPVARELPPAWQALFPRSIVGGCLQGWLRHWDGQGKIHVRSWPQAPSWLGRWAVAFVSEEDLGGDLGLAERYAAHCPQLVLTRAARGAILYREGRSQPIAPFRVEEVDPTGAGDVFAAAFLIRSSEGASPEEAGRFAAATAALSVRGAGAGAIPRRREVEALLRRVPDVVSAP